MGIHLQVQKKKALTNSINLSQVFSSKIKTITQINNDGVEKQKSSAFNKRQAQQQQLLPVRVLLAPRKDPNVDGLPMRALLPTKKPIPRDP